MPDFDLDIDPDARLARVRFSGALKSAATFEALHTLVRDLRFVTGMSGLLDLRAVDSLELFGDEVRAGAGRVGRLGDVFVGSRWALVATSDSVFGIARQFALMASDPRSEVRAYRSVEEAEAFLRGNS